MNNKEYGISLCNQGFKMAPMKGATSIPANRVLSIFVDVPDDLLIELGRSIADDQLSGLFGKL
jgi:hypothetical protein